MISCIVELHAQATQHLNVARAVIRHLTIKLRRQHIRIPPIHAIALTAHNLSVNVHRIKTIQQALSTKPTQILKKFTLFLTVPEHL